MHGRPVSSAACGSIRPSKTLILIAPLEIHNMPASTSGKVLVTGVNGYIASWTVKAFLDAGFSVRAAIRSEGKVMYIKRQFSSFGDKLEFVFVPNIAKVNHC